MGEPISIVLCVALLCACGFALAFQRQATRASACAYRLARMLRTERALTRALSERLACAKDPYRTLGLGPEEGPMRVPKQDRVLE